MLGWFDHSFIERILRKVIFLENAILFQVPLKAAVRGTVKCICMLVVSCVFPSKFIKKSFDNLKMIFWSRNLISSSKLKLCIRRMKLPVA